MRGAKREHCHSAHRYEALQDEEVHPVHRCQFLCVAKMLQFISAERPRVFFAQPQENEEAGGGGKEAEQQQQQAAD